MKKKNLLKCLALTSMLALSVGAVTSCGTQGEAGKDGAQGAQGVQGAQGEKGDKGDKGDPIYTVILLDDGISTNVVSGTDGTSYTLTFTPGEGKIVTELMINYVEVELTDEILNGSYTGTLSGNDAVVKASFGTIASYTTSVLEKEFWALWDSDKQINATFTTTHEEPEDFIKSDYWADTTNVYKVVGTYEKKAADAVKALSADATVKEKIDAIKLVIAEAKTKLEEAHQTAITAAKAKAVKKLDEIDKSFGSTKEFTSEDRATILASAKAEVAAAKSVEEIAGIVNSAVDADGIAVGKYTNLYNAKKEAFKAVKQSLTDITDTLFATGNEEKLEAVKTTLSGYGISVDALPSEVAAKWNSDISKATDLPRYTEDAASTSTDTYSAGNVIMGYEGAKAVAASYTDIKDKLVKAIQESYYKEINESKVLSADGMTTLRGIVNGAIADWLRDNDSDSVTVSISAYLDASASYDVASNKSTGLISQIEGRLNAATTAKYEAFAAERLTNAMADAYALAKAEIKEVKADTVYSSIFGSKATAAAASGSGNSYAKGDLLVSKYIGSVDADGGNDARILNPFVTNVSSGTVVLASSKDTGNVSIASPTYAAMGTAVAKTPTNAGSIAISTTDYNVDNALDLLFEVNTDGTFVKAADATNNGSFNKNSSIQQIKSASNQLAGIFKEIKNNAVEFYKDEMLKALDGSDAQATSGQVGLGKDDAEGFSSETGHIGVFYSATAKYITSANIDTIYGDSFTKVNGVFSAKDTTLSDISGVAYKLVSNAGDLKDFDAKLNTWALGNKADTGLVDSTTLLIKSTNGVYKAALDNKDATSIINQILAGTLDGSEDIQKAVNGLTEIYAADVVTYGENTLKSLEEFYNGKVSGQTATAVEFYKQAYNNILKTFAYDVCADGYSGSLKNVAVEQRHLVDGQSYLTCDTWLAKAKAWISSTETTVSGVTTATKAASITLTDDADRVLELELIDKGVITGVSSTDLKAKQNDLLSSLVIKTPVTDTEFASAGTDDAALTGLVITVTKGDGTTTADVDVATHGTDFAIVKDGTVVSSAGKVIAAGDMQVVYKGVLTFTIAVTVA